MKQFIGMRPATSVVLSLATGSDVIALGRREESETPLFTGIFRHKCLEMLVNSRVFKEHRDPIL
jgi:hypothetical protein